MTINERLTALRSSMKSHHIHAYIIPSSDPHQSEYVPDHFKSRAWISGFTGSAGTVVVTLNEAGLWTDSRYFIQAESQLEGTGIDLHKVKGTKSEQPIDWIIKNLENEQTIGMDGRLFSTKQIALFEKKIKDKGLNLALNLDLISDIWIDRPILPPDLVYDLDVSLAGETRTSKLKRIREIMKEQDAAYHLITTLDDIAWVFNIRGTDVTYNPVTIAYALISDKDAKLYIDPSKATEELTRKLLKDGVIITPYHKIWEDLNKLSDDSSILIDEQTINHNLFRAINCEKINKPLPSIAMKAVKNKIEIEHFRKVMIKDGVALTKFYIWLENHLDEGYTEYDLTQKIIEFRNTQDDYQMESFGAIVGYKGNGAIVHYSPHPETSALIKNTGVLLIDSGGQYLDGTTDITRTVSLGDETQEEKDAYTRVLKGNIALDKAIFPEGTLGVQLDTLARQFLWANNLDYGHGTGHGVGFFLNVHEGPQGFASGIVGRSKHTIDLNMVTTNEPGYYETGKFGIRIENCLLTIEKGETDSGKFLGFETLTLFPIETSLIDFNLLTKEEVTWLNNYHQKVFDALAPNLDKEEQEWLKIKCAPI